MHVVRGDGVHLYLHIYYVLVAVELVVDVNSYTSM